MKIGKAGRFELSLSVILIAIFLPLMLPASGPAESYTHPMVAAGYFSTLGLNDDGTVEVTGRCYYDSDLTTVRNWSGITQVAAGEDYFLGLKSDGTVLATGDNYHGQLNVDGWSDIIQVAAGAAHTVGLRNNGTVLAIGWNDDGQCDVSGWIDIIQVAAGWDHTVGLKSDGTVVATGSNNWGQLEVGGWSGITQVAAADGYTVGLTSDGTVVSTDNESYDTRSWTDIIQVAAGNCSVVGLSSNGTVVSTINDDYYDVYDWSDIIQVAAGSNHIVGLRSNGAVLGTGPNPFGQIYVNSWLLIDLYQKGYDDGYAAGLTAELIDTMSPTGSLHVVDDWASNSKSVKLTISGYVRDEMSIFRDGAGCGVSEAFIMINDTKTIRLTLGEDGTFSFPLTLGASKDAVFKFSLYARDSVSNRGLVDEITVRSPKAK